jgi:hypothetical protein
MRNTVLAPVAGLLLAVCSFAQEKKEVEASPKIQPSLAVLSPAELEAKFSAMLTNATLSGRWAALKEGALGEENEDKYHIVRVAKISGDSWVVHAKLKYNDREFIAPLPVKVRWAGDTPVMIVDNLAMPGGTRSYSARVMFYEHTYSGTWSGGDHGGMLYGTITNEKSEKEQKRE